MKDSISSEHILRTITACLPETDNIPGLEALEFTLSAKGERGGTGSPILHVYFPHEFHARWFRQHGHVEGFEYAAHLAFGSDLCIKYHQKSGERKNSASVPGTPLKKEDGAAPTALLSEIRREEYSFDSFISGQKNELAVSTIINMLSDLERGVLSYNPLLLRGLPGTGKSHLLHATAARLRSIPSLAEQGRIYVLSASDFAGLFRQSPARREAGRAMLRGCAALCLDDTQQLVRSPQAQEELADLIDVLIAKKRPVLCACSYLSPRQRAELAGADAADTVSEEQLAPALLSRLRKGMVLDLTEADLDVRMRYARHMLQELNLNTDNETPLLLARRCGQIRHLHGVILRMHAFFRHTGTMPDEQDLEGFFRASGSRDTLTPEAVMSLVATHYGFTSRDLRGKKRDSPLVEARQVAMYLCRELLGESYPSLGRIFGGNDHSTVMHAVKKIREIQVRNKDMHILITELTQRCLNRI